MVTLSDNLHCLHVNLPSPRTVQEFALHHRGWIGFAIICVAIWSFGSGLHKGEPAVFIKRDMAVGDVISATDVALGFIDGAIAAYITDAQQVIGRQLTQSVVAGTPITAAAITKARATNNRVVISMPLEDSDPGNYAVGTHVHVWSITEEFATLISSEAIVVMSNRDAMSAHSLTVSVPREDENAMMQARVVRVAAVG